MMAIPRRTRMKSRTCCGKKAYATQAAAEKAIWKISLVSSRDKVPQRAYQCRFEWWHLTSQTRRTDPPQTADELVYERDEYRCVKCGVGIYAAGGWSIHHRRNRASGGSSKPEISSPANLLLLCGDGTTLCHGWVTTHPAKARALGYVVSTNSQDDPAEVKVFHAVHDCWVYLAHDGGWRPA